MLPKGDLEIERVIFDYGGIELKNFHLLNSAIASTTTTGGKAIDEKEVTELQKQMQEALSNEEYEVANELKLKIEKIINTK